MSGSGSGIGFGSNSSQSEECQEIYRSISVLSVNPDILEKLSRGSNLTFQIETKGQNKSLLLYYENERFGAITKYAAQIINCIEKELEYIAIVSSIDGGSCLIEAKKVETS